jgi:hypothetical protein
MPRLEVLFLGLLKGTDLRAHSWIVGNSETIQKWCWGRTTAISSNATSGPAMTSGCP